MSRSGRSLREVNDGGLSLRLTYDYQVFPAAAACSLFCRTAAARCDGCLVEAPQTWPEPGAGRGGGAGWEAPLWGGAELGWPGFGPWGAGLP